jgi:hypothetical protein|tara:strand:- start:1073 stop:1294 length:222 start_codon:yes stop_codon:yes gene_type:complete
MKYLILLLAILSFGGVFYGFLVESEASQKFIGFGVVGIFFLVIPLFSYFRWKDRDVKDYTITKENLDKMRGKE